MNMFMWFLHAPEKNGDFLKWVFKYGMIGFKESEMRFLMTFPSSGSVNVLVFIPLLIYSHLIIYKAQ